MLGNGATAIKSRNLEEEKPRRKWAATFAISAEHQRTRNVWVSLTTHNSGNGAFINLEHLLANKYQIRNPSITKHDPCGSYHDMEYGLGNTLT